MAGKYNQWLRKTLAERIRNNGGYYADRHTHFALSWNVPFYLDGFDDEEEAKDTLVEQEYFLNVADLNLQLPDFDKVFQQADGHLWANAQERLASDLKDDDGMRMWSPDTAKRYGFDYKGKGADECFEMTLGNYGRGGKHVCLEEFEGIALNKGAQDVADAIDPSSGSDFMYDIIHSNQWCRQLMGIMDELDSCLTRENAARSGQYYAADYLAYRLGVFD